MPARILESSKQYSQDFYRHDDGAVLNTTVFRESRKYHDRMMDGLFTLLSLSIVMAVAYVAPVAIEIPD